MQNETLELANETRADFLTPLSIQQLFEAEVARSPEAPAALFGPRRLTYRELNERANRLAHLLRARGVRPEQVVGICLESSLDLPVAVLGVLKAGAAYLPLDPTYPQNRLSFMLEDAGVRLLLTSQHLREKATYLNVDSVFALDGEEEAALLERQPVGNPSLLSTSRNACYVIYTSGSTGRPKGVVIEHRGLVNLIQALREILALGPGRRVLQFASFSFDQSVQELFSALLCGATLCLARREDLMPGEPLLRVLKEQSITDTTLGPSVLAHLPDAELPELRTVVAGGEVCPASIAERWGARRRFFNAYGPTETTWGASMERCGPGGGRPGIGGPLPNVRYYVVGEGGERRGVGVPGELRIGGVGVGRGYLNRPDLTAERFRPDPWSGEPGERLYQTGDLVKWREAGTLDYIGRMDKQVKMRGFRIELGEIEAVLAEHPAIVTSVVTVYGEREAEKELVVYLMSEGGLTAEDLELFLAAKLPDYMVPHLYVFLDQIPLTRSGKVDLLALPSPEVARRRKPYVAPRTAVEQTMTELWLRVLQTDRVGVHDNLFDLGASSLQATMLSTLLQDTFKVKAPLAAVFDHPTLEGLCGFVAASLSRRDEQAEAFSGQPADGGNGPDGARVISLRKAARGTRHLFFIHDLSGHLHALTQLGKLLSPDVNVWGVEAAADGNEEVLEVSLPRMATDYIGKMRALQSDGAWHVGGWSFGGAVAYEIARQLDQAGERVALLAAIDADALESPLWNDLNVSFLANLRAAFPQASLAIAPLADKSRECQLLLNRVGRYRHAKDDIKAATPEYIRLAIVEWEELNQEELIKRLKKVVAYAGALASYVPGEPIQLAVEDFRATSGDSSRVAGNWESLVSGPVRSHRLEGDHRTMLTSPGVSTLAARLSEAL